MIEVRQVFLRSSAANFTLTYAYILKDDFHEYALSLVAEGWTINEIAEYVEDAYSKPVGLFFGTKPPAEWIINDVNTGEPLWLANSGSWVDVANAEDNLGKQISQWNASTFTNVVPLIPYPHLLNLRNFLDTFDPETTMLYLEKNGFNSTYFSRSKSVLLKSAIPVLDTISDTGGFEYVCRPGYVRTINGHVFGEVVMDGDWTERTLVDLVTGKTLSHFGYNTRFVDHSRQMKASIMEGYLKAVAIARESNTTVDHLLELEKGNQKEYEQYRAFLIKHAVNYDSILKGRVDDSCRNQPVSLHLV